MGNESSSKNTTQSVPYYPDDYHPPVDSFAHYNYPVSTKQNPVRYNKRNYDSQTQLKSVSHISRIIHL
jgi:hypothetical protein